eukprot:4047561-Karenia_brevis.AAC.1
MHVVAEILEIISEVMVTLNWGARKINDGPVRWKKRDFNKEADYLANYAMDTREDFRFWNHDVLSQGVSSIRNIQGWSDGGCRVDQNISSYGWIIKCWTDAG